MCGVPIMSSRAIDDTAPASTHTGGDITWTVATRPRGRDWGSGTWIKEGDSGDQPKGPSSARLFGEASVRQALVFCEGVVRRWLG